MPKSLPELSFHCQTLTPLFLYGYKPGQLLELREESIIGLLRYWTRAVYPTLEQARSLEIPLFGNSDQRGALNLLAYFVYPGKPLVPTNRNANQSGATRPDLDSVPGRDKNKSGAGLPMPGFAEECAFVVSLAFRKSFAEYGVRTRALFLLASYLGGLGRRSRRGMGSFRVTATAELSDTGAAQLIDAPTFNNIASFQQYIFSLLDVLTPNEFVMDGCFIRRCTYQNPGYPIIRNIGFGQQPQTPNDIHTVTHTLMGIDIYTEDNYGMAMGRVKKGRLASPMYTSLVKIGDHLYPIVTELASSDEAKEQIPQIRDAYRQQLHIQ